MKFLVVTEEAFKKKFFIVKADSGEEALLSVCYLVYGEKDDGHISVTSRKLQDKTYCKTSITINRAFRPPIEITLYAYDINNIMNGASNVVYLGENDICSFGKEFDII